MEPTGKIIAELRKERDLSQGALAKEVGVSQATISRLEALENEGADIRLLSKIARALGQRLDALLPEDFLKELSRDSIGDLFVAFCPNPLCMTNKVGLDREGRPSVTWESAQSYPSSGFLEYNYCPECGEELVKECPECKRRFETKRPRFCFTCGARVCERPTDEEWKIIRQHLAKKAEDANPSGDIPF